jgi:hypothetical protein
MNNKWETNRESIREKVDAIISDNVWDSINLHISLDCDDIARNFIWSDEFENLRRSFQWDFL